MFEFSSVQPHSVQADGTVGCSPFLSGHGPFGGGADAEEVPGEQFLVGDVVHLAGQGFLG